jgi:hypothetical protein
MDRRRKNHIPPLDPSPKQARIADATHHADGDVKSMPTAGFRGISHRRSDFPHQGMDLKKTLDFAKKNGFEVEHKRRSGEKFLRHPSTSRAVRFNGRRKDTSREVIHVRSIQRRI